MVRLFFGAAIHKMLSNRPGASLLSRVSFTGCGRKTGAWTASAGPEGKRNYNSLHPAPIFARSRGNTTWMLLTPPKRRGKSRQRRLPFRSLSVPRPTRSPAPASSLSRSRTKMSPTAPTPPSPSAERRIGRYLPQGRFWPPEKPGKRPRSSRPQQRWRRPRSRGSGEKTTTRAAMSPHSPAKASEEGKAVARSRMHWACAPVAEPSGKPSAPSTSWHGRDGDQDFKSQHSSRYQEGGAARGALEDSNSQHASPRASSPIASLAGPALLPGMLRYPPPPCQSAR